MYGADTQMLCNAVVDTSLVGANAILVAVKLRRHGLKVRIGVAVIVRQCFGFLINNC